MRARGRARLRTHHPASPGSVIGLGRSSSAICVDEKLMWPASSITFMHQVCAVGAGVVFNCQSCPLPRGSPCGFISSFTRRSHAQISDIRLSLSVNLIRGLYKLVVSSCTSLLSTSIYSSKKSSASWPSMMGPYMQTNFLFSLAHELSFQPSLTNSTQSSLPSQLLGSPSCQSTTGSGLT